jgi:hypothetical protein
MSLTKSADLHSPFTLEFCGRPQEASPSTKRIPSKLNGPIRVPATAFTLTAVRTAAEPPYACGAHATVVADVHALLPHASLAVSEAVAVGPAPPKLNPLIVTVPPPPLKAAFAALAETVLTTGAASSVGMDNVAMRSGVVQRTIEAERPYQSACRCIHTHRSAHRRRAAVRLRRACDRRRGRPCAAAARFARSQRGRGRRTGGAKAQPADRDRAAAAAESCVGRCRAHSRCCKGQHFAPNQCCSGQQCSAPSKLNCPVRVPATAFTLTAVRTAAEPPYACGAHATVVADVHALLPHASLAVSEAVAVGPAAPKLNPLIVTVPPALDAALLGLFPLTTGAAIDKGHGNSNAPVRQHLKLSQAAENAPSKVKPRLAVLVKTLNQASRPAPTRTGARAAQTSCVFVVHAVVAHGWPETYADGLKSLH